MPFECNVHATNAPVICTEGRLAEEKAELDGRSLSKLAPDDTLITLIQQAAKTGQWVLVDAVATSHDTLREAVYAVWLHCTYDHHKDFCAWFQYPPFLAPRHTDYYSLEGSSQRAHYSLSPTRGGRSPDDEVEQRLIISKANEHLPAALVAAAVYLRYCESFDAEFKVNCLINAIGNSQVYRTAEFRDYIELLPPRNVVGAFELCQREDIFVALAEAGKDSPSLREIIISARTENNTSPMDVALTKEYQAGAQALQRFGCRSDVFDYDQLAKPSFREMLRVLLDPVQPFPFDPVVTAARIAADGNSEMLSRLFNCRIDVGFGATDYPVAEAALSGSEDAVWVVLDRMGVTGVNPLTDERWAFHHTLEILHHCAIECEGGFSFGETSLWLIRRLLPVAQDDERHPIPASLLVRAKLYPDVVVMLLNMVDIEQERDLPTLLRFFIEFDPSSPLASQVLDLAFRGLSTAPAVEEEAFSLLGAMLGGGARCAPLFEQGVSSVLYYGYMDLAYVGHGPETVLFQAVRSGVESNVRWLLTRPSARAVKKLVSSCDTSGRTCLQWILDELSPNTEDTSNAYLCDVARMLLVRGSPTRPEMFGQAVEGGYGGLCYELLPATNKAGNQSLPVSLPSLLLSQLCQRYLQLPTFAPLPVLEDVDDNANYSPPDDRMGVSSSIGSAPLPVLAAIFSYCDEDTTKAAALVSVSLYLASLLPLPLTM